MKTALVLFHNPEEEFPSDYLADICNSLSAGGFSAGTVEVLSLNDDLGFKRCVRRFKETHDSLIVINNSAVTFDLKEMIAEQTESVLMENDNAVKFLQELSFSHGKSYDLSNAVMPIDATLIPNTLGAFQGFITEDEDFSLVLVSQELNEIKEAFKKYLFPYFENKFGITDYNMTLKYFGSGEELNGVIKADLTDITAKGVKIHLSQKYGDYTISISAKDKDGCRDVAKRLLLALKDGIYAETDTTLSQRVFDLLRIKKQKIATAESFTAGRIISSIIQNSGASAYVHEGIVCYSNESKRERMGIENSVLQKEGAVSSMTAYRMVTGLLRNGMADIAVSTTGVAGPNGDGSDAPVGLCFIGIGMIDGVHTYKINLTGSREEITETAKNTALFLTYKKLKSLV